MATKRLIPYSVHLPEDVYEKLKKAAQQRQASALVRDAITMALENADSYESGYNKGVRDCIAIFKKDPVLKLINTKQIEAQLKSLLKGK